MDTQSLTLRDLKPKEASFTLEAFPEQKFTLKKFSLLAQLWCKETFGDDRLKEIFKDQYLPDLAKIAYYLLKEKEKFPTYESLIEEVCTHQDKVGLINAILATIGFSAPVVKAMQEGDPAPNALSPDPK